MPAEGLPWLDRAELLTFEEIERLVRLFVPLGVADVRLTGGEPLVRRELPKLVAMLSAIEGLEDLSLTTNGYLLERMADELVAAGLGASTSRSTRSRATASSRSRAATPSRR